MKTTALNYVKNHPEMNEHEFCKREEEIGTIISPYSGEPQKIYRGKNISFNRETMTGEISYFEEGLDGEACNFAKEPINYEKFLEEIKDIVVYC